MVISAFGAALSAFAVPGPSGPVTGLAALLAFCAVALAAENDWAEPATVAVNLALAAKVVPKFVNSVSSLSWTATALAISSICVVPGLIFFAARLPKLIEIVVGNQRPGLRRMMTPTVLVASICWVCLPTANLVASRSFDTVSKPVSPGERKVVNREINSIRAALYRDPKRVPVGHPQATELNRRASQSARDRLQTSVVDRDNEPSRTFTKK